MTRVLDANALIAYLEKEPGYEKVRDILASSAESGRNCLMTCINWGEIYYITHRERGQDGAEEVMNLVATFPIEIIEVNQELAKQAAIYKATKRMSYADCFAAALAKLKRGELITGDKEFKQLESDVKITWI